MPLVQADVLPTLVLAKPGRAWELEPPSWRENRRPTTPAQQLCLQPRLGCPLLVVKNAAQWVAPADHETPLQPVIGGHHETARPQHLTPDATLADT